MRTKYLLELLLGHLNHEMDAIAGVVLLQIFDFRFFILGGFELFFEEILEVSDPFIRGEFSDFYGCRVHDSASTFNCDLRLLVARNLASESLLRLYIKVES